MAHSVEPTLLLKKASISRLFRVCCVVSEMKFSLSFISLKFFCHFVRLKEETLFDSLLEYLTLGGDGVEKDLFRLSVFCRGFVVVSTGSKTV